MAAGGVVMFIFADVLIRLFTDDNAVVQIGAQYLRIAAFILYAYVILLTYVSLLQGLKRPMFAIWIGLFRQIGAPVMLFYLLAHYLGLGLMGIWGSIFLITWFSACISIVYGQRILRKVTQVEIQNN